MEVLREIQRKLRVIREPSERGLLLNKETKLERKLFSDEVKFALEKDGYIFYSLTGKSIKDLRENGRKIYVPEHERWYNLQDFENLASMESEVAINPSLSFVPLSYNSLDRQESIVMSLSRELGKMIPGAKAIIGEASDYTELAFLHLDATEERLIADKSSKESLLFARTKTRLDWMNGFYTVTVGNRFPDGSVSLSTSPAIRGERNTLILPLIVPA